MESDAFIWSVFPPYPMHEDDDIIFFNDEDIRRKLKKCNDGCQHSVCSTKITKRRGIVKLEALTLVCLENTMVLR